MKIMSTQANNKEMFKRINSLAVKIDTKSGSTDPNDF